MQEPNAPEEAAADAKKEEDKGANLDSKVDNTADDGEGDKNWADQMTYIEEEPWPRDLQPKWPNYSRGV